ncbi:helix-turn-helix domain-containing protein [Pseudomonas sp. N040]|uniref:helix-turn-helix domain-containing protein n=1 Tax=Pseudomonas sp. N040 TaxID=2785325 RepID=UPI0018A27C48|nr:cupin domain-containing protein [Pseudomonas sp. N040]MBF7729152.1 cupin domain-containing protein [Pseudomonas sp. N040]MBW7012792.1 cupin domain-containing protein [Pseudomonas sp. N040]
MNRSATEALAQTIRDLRTRRKVTVRQLAEQIGRSIGFISQIERGLSQPSVEDLLAISQALGVPFTYFVEPAHGPQHPWITRPGARRTLGYARGVSDQVISPNLSSQLILLETRLEAGADFGERNLIDSAEQAGYVLEGELTLWVNDEELRVRAGDGFQIPAGVPCRCANQSTGITRVVWVYS